MGRSFLSNISIWYKQISEPNPLSRRMCFLVNRSGATFPFLKLRMETILLESHSSEDGYFSKENRNAILRRKKKKKIPQCQKT